MIVAINRVVKTKIAANTSTMLARKSYRPVTVAVT